MATDTNTRDPMRLTDAEANQIIAFVQKHRPGFNCVFSEKRGAVSVTIGMNIVANFTTRTEGGYYRVLAGYQVTGPYMPKRPGSSWRTNGTAWRKDLGALLSFCLDFLRGENHYEREETATRRAYARLEEAMLDRGMMMSGNLATAAFGDGALLVELWDAVYGFGIDPSDRWEARVKQIEAHQQCHAALSGMAEMWRWLDDSIRAKTIDPNTWPMYQRQAEGEAA